jgi:hypothetical protein
MVETHDNGSDAISDDNWKTVREYTAETSKVCRQLAFAIGGVLVVFLSKSTSILLSTTLAMLIMYFFLDVIQYLLATCLNKDYAEQYDENKLAQKRRFNPILYRIFYTKIFVLVIASILLAFMLFCVHTH